MELTKDEAVRLHRELWDWLSKNPEAEKESWPGWINFDSNWVEHNMHCFACMCSKNCSDCLMQWPGLDCCCGGEDDKYADEQPGLFVIWLESKGNKEQRTCLAEQIRDLPVRIEL